MGALLPGGRHCRMLACSNRHILESDMKCDQCEMLSINGIACHETGCPNEGNAWIEGEWVKQYECPECGTMHTNREALSECCALVEAGADFDEQYEESLGFYFEELYS